VDVSVDVVPQPANSASTIAAARMMDKIFFILSLPLSEFYFKFFYLQIFGHRSAVLPPFGE
jgi:hypothetical protein